MNTPRKSTMRAAHVVARGLQLAEKRAAHSVLAFQTSKPLRHSSQQLLLTRYASSSASVANDKPEDAHKYAWAVTDIAPPSPGRGIVGRSANFDVTERQDQYKRWEWLLKLLGFMNEDDRLYRHSLRVLQSCMIKTALPEFYQALHLMPDFRAQQALLMAHVWIVHRRLSHDGDEGKIMQEVIFDRLWEETVVRIRFMNVSELTVNKHLAEVQQQCFNACIAYDRGLKEGQAMLQNAVAKHLLDDETPTGQRIATSLAEYMKRELKNLEKVDSKYIMEGTIPWGPHPSVKIVTAADEEDQDEYTLIGQQFGNWRTALDNRGKLYYWNLTTRMSSWERPTGDKLSEGFKTETK